GGENNGPTPRVQQAKLVSTAPTVTVNDHKMTGGPIPTSGCAAPTAKINFISTDEQAHQWVFVSGANLGDVIGWEFVQPNGTVYGQTATQPLAINGSVCSSASIAISGNA